MGNDTKGAYAKLKHGTKYVDPNNLILFDNCSEVEVLWEIAVFSSTERLHVWLWEAVGNNGKKGRLAFK